MEYLKISDLIAKRLSPQVDGLRLQFYESKNNIGIRYFYIDNLLPLKIANESAEAFPEKSVMRLMNSFREKKYTSKSLSRFKPIISEVTFAFQAPEVINLVEGITGFKNQKADVSLYAGGLSAMEKGHFLGPHIDNSHDGSRKYYRTLNLLYYVSPNWLPQSGGHLELWGSDVNSKITIESVFNRLVVMETNSSSWHSVSRVLEDGVRQCVSNYYFSTESPSGEAYFHVTEFSAPLNRPFLRFLGWADGRLRNLVRLIKRDGFSKKDIYIEVD